jgi:hypothetical protein
VLDFLKKNNFDEYLIKIYTLKHLTRSISYKEDSKTKSLKDIFIYAKELSFNIQPGWKVVRKYHVLNRFIPQPIFLFLKKVQCKLTF